MYRSGEKSKLIIWLARYISSRDEGDMQTAYNLLDGETFTPHKRQRIIPADSGTAQGESPSSLRLWDDRLTRFIAEQANQPSNIAQK